MATASEAKATAQTALLAHAKACTVCTKEDRCKAGATLLADLFKALDVACGRPVGAISLKRKDQVAA